MEKRSLAGLPRTGERTSQAIAQERAGFASMLLLLLRDDNSFCGRRSGHSNCVGKQADVQPSVSLSDHYQIVMSVGPGFLKNRHLPGKSHDPKILFGQEIAFMQYNELIVLAHHHALFRREKPDDFITLQRIVRFGWSFREQWRCYNED